MTPTALTLDLLAWLAARPRTYEETIDAWKTSCPRLSVWDDAIIGGLVRVHRDGVDGRIVTLTELGRAALLARDREMRNERA